MRKQMIRDGKGYSHSRIDQLVSEFLKEDYPAIEYKSKHCRSFAIAAGA